MKGPVVFAICDVPLQESFPLSPAEETDLGVLHKVGISRGEGKKEEKGDSGLSSEFKELKFKDYLE